MHENSSPLFFVVLFGLSVGFHRVYKPVTKNQLPSQNRTGQCRRFKTAAALQRSSQSHEGRFDDCPPRPRLSRAGDSEGPMRLEGIIKSFSFAGVCWMTRRARLFEGRLRPR